MAKWYKFGRYYLLRHIATGGMAEIYLAKQIGLEGFEKLLVIKKILNQYAENDEFITMFLDEARLAAKLDQPNIVQIYDLGKQNTSYYIAMEYIPGEDLRTIMKKMTKRGEILEFKHSLHMISCLCEALDYAHKKKDNTGKPLNIIHRDVSPQNIMVSYSGNAKILDFGIAKATTQSTETEAGVLKGKYAYMSPEQAKGKKLDHRSDIFSIGILLFELLTNHRLFKAKNQLDTLRKLVYEEIPTPQDFNPEVPDELNRITMKALDKDTETRYQTARELQNDIEEFLANAHMISSTTRTAEFMQDIFAEEIDAMQQLQKRITEEQKEVLASDLPDISQDTGMFESDPGVSSFNMIGQNTSISSLNRGGSATSFSNTNISRITSQSGILSAQVNTFTPKSKLPLVIGLLILLVGATIAALLISQNKNSKKNTQPDIIYSGRLSINTNPSKAVIYINGKINKEKTPAIVEKLPLNKPIPIKIEKEGYASIIEEIIIPNGDELVQYKFDLKVEKNSVKYGLVKILSTPEGSDIYLDNKKLSKKTPATLQEIQVGTHNILLEQKGYDSYFIKFDLKADELKKIEGKLFKIGTAKHSFLTVKSNAPKATIEIDGKEIEGAVVKYKVPFDKELVIQVSAKGYEQKKQIVKLKRNEEKTIEIVLDRKRFRKQLKKKEPTFGKLNLSVLKGSKIYIDGRYLGKSSITNHKLSIGTHRIKIKNSSLMINYTTSIAIASGNNTRVINIKKGRLALSVKPWAYVYVNGIKKGQTPMRPFKLYEGTYTIKLMNENKKTIVEKINIRPGKLEFLKKTLQNK